MSLPENLPYNFTPFGYFYTQGSFSDGTTSYASTSAVLELYGEGVSGSTTIIDSSPWGHAVSGFGNVGQPTLDTDANMWGTAAIKFDNDPTAYRQHLKVAFAPEFLIDTNDFTIETFFKLNNVDEAFNMVYHDANEGFTTYGSQISIGSYEPYIGGVHPGTITIFSHLFSNAQKVWRSAAGRVSANTKHHLVFQRTGSSFQIFLDGVNITSDDTSTTMNTTYGSSFPSEEGNFYIGAYRSSTAYAFDGWMDNFRIINGEGVYPTAGFTPVDVTEVISRPGEQPINYLRNIYEDQYEYFTKATEIIVLEDPDSNVLNETDETNGEFRLRTFIDQVEN